MTKTKKNCECGNTIASHSTWDICMKCRENRKCQKCNNKISKTSRLGLCKKCIITVRSKNNGRGNEKELDIKDFLEYTNLIIQLEKIDKNLLSRKWLSRTLYKESPILWKNIYWYTRNYKNINIQERIERIKIGANFFPIHQGFNREQIILKKGPVQGYISFVKNKTKNLNHNVGSLGFYQDKYGTTEGKQKYYDRYIKLLNKQSKPYSKISKELYDNLNVDAYYADEEWRVTLFQKERDKLGQMVVYLDFLYGNKVIEFDGSYWHNNPEKDRIRDEILTKRGYEILRIPEKDYNKNKMKVVRECLKFLETP